MELSTIESKIYEIRGIKVMLDFDLAGMYGIETGQLKRAVRRNIERFEGEDFMFELTWDELSKCQIGILNKNRGANFKYRPFAFTELGVAMLSSVLNSEKAIEINRSIMRAFVAVRAYLFQQTSVSKEIEELRMRMEDLEDYNRITDDAISDLYVSLTALAKKVSDTPVPRHNPVGYVIPKNND